MRFVPVGVALLLALVASPASAVWLPGGNVPRPGELFCNKALAATYTRILRETGAAAGGD